MSHSSDANLPDRHSQTTPKRRARRRWLLVTVGLLLLGIAGSAVWQLLPETETVYTDAGALRIPAGLAKLRDILWQPPELVPGLSLPEDVSEPALTADANTLYFVRNASDGNADIYRARRTVDGWSEATPVAELNSRFNDLGPMPTRDGLTIYFYSDRPGGHGGYDIWMARRDDPDAPFDPPVNMDLALNTRDNECTPALSPDGQTLYFASDRVSPADRSDERQSVALVEDETDRNFDLFAITRVGGPWRDAQPLTGLNTSADEIAPALSPLGDFLYFASDRPESRGGLDIFRARLRGDIPQEAEHLGDTVNSPAHETDPFVTDSGYALYFATDRVSESASDAIGLAGPVSRPYRLHVSLSREVVRDVNVRRGNFDWASLWQAVRPSLLAALIALLLLLILSRLFDAATRRKLSLLAKCLLVSLAAHVILMLVLSIWNVTATIAGLIPREGGTKVMLTSAAGSEGFVSQIRGGFTAVDSPAPAERSERSSLQSQALTLQPASADLPQPASSPSMATEHVRFVQSTSVQPVSRQASATARPPAKPQPQSASSRLTPAELPSPKATPRPAPVEAKQGPPRPAASSAHQVQRSDAARAIAPTTVALAAPAATYALAGELSESQASQAAGEPVRAARPRENGSRRATDVPDSQASFDPQSTGVALSVDSARAAPSPTSEASIEVGGGGQPATGRSERAAVSWRAVQPSHVELSAPSTSAGGAETSSHSFAAADDLPQVSAQGSISGSQSLQPAMPVASRRESAVALRAPGSSEEPTRAQGEEATLGMPGVRTLTANGSRVPLAIPGVGRSTPVSIDAPAPTGGDSLSDVTRTLNPGSTLPAGISPAATRAPVALTSPSDLQPVVPHLVEDIPFTPPKRSRRQSLAEPNMILGRVVDAVTGKALEDATVRLDRSGADPLTCLTDAVGEFSLKVPPMPAFFALSASFDGYLPASVNIAGKDVQERTVWVDFELQPATDDSVAIETVPDVHHLGDDRFEGLINSKFQKRSEGALFRAEFVLRDDQIAPYYRRCEMSLMARGVQLDNSIYINKERLDRRLNRSPGDGSFGEIRIPIPMELLQAGANTLMIRSHRRGSDYDDFEFVNVQFHLER